jgi:hypothetical protein
VTESITEPARSAGHETCNHRIYGLNCEEFERLLERADGHCELCGIAVTETPRGLLVVDHDGRYGWSAVRGMICDKCNAHMRRVDSGERKVDPAARHYCKNAWFTQVSAYRAGLSPIRRWEHPDWELWRGFGALADRKRVTILRHFVAWYCGKRRECPKPGQPFVPVESAEEEAQEEAVGDLAAMQAAIDGLARDVKRGAARLTALEAQAVASREYRREPYPDVLTVEF